MDHDTPIALRLELETGSTPLRGSLGPPGEEPTEFSGMLQLMALIERHSTTGQTTTTSTTSTLRNPS